MKDVVGGQPENTQSPSKPRTMTKARAREIHAHFAASVRLAVVIPACLLLLFLAMGVDFPNALALFGLSLGFVGVMAAVSTAMMSKRIPNGLSLTVLCSAPFWWLGAALGADMADGAGTGIVLDAFGWFYNQPISGSVLPVFDVALPYSIGLDLAMMVVVFVPLYLSFAFGLGFGGGDVKLMTAAAALLGWPLGMDFFFLTFLIGGLFSAAVLLGRMSSLIAVRLGVSNPHVVALSKFREFPFAPAIGLAAVLCFATKMQGLI